MDTNEYDEQDLFIVDFSQNIHNITDEQDNNSDSNNNVEEIQNEENVSGRDDNRSRDQDRENSKLHNFLPPPFFDNFQHTKPLHKFTQIEIIVKNTNKYAYMKDVGEGRKWKELTIKEFRIWLAILIYADVFKLPNIQDD
ncbi:hypothetical protein RhiirC2_773723 [Rhizophagus irregularis]|uniref:PiggyBac transposable element-derived protein domain-containing protein n=1 Tax=Rhizophagus irregularis TaxID=588596 RepID=A0A2N1NN88_9GLOM|nr:hypothetical protein RhiirC2_773723 [Rhizophagus irregularis]